MKSDHIDERYIAIDISCIPEEVLSLKCRSDVPPEPVPALPKPANQRFGMLNTIIFHVQDGMRPRQNPLSAHQHPQLRAFNVDFDQPDDPIPYQRIQSLTGDGLHRTDGFRRRLGSHRSPAKIPRPVIIRRAKADGAFLIPASHAKRPDIVQSIESEVGA